MEIVIENVTPTKAESWLNLNRSNRKLKDGVVERYADDMRHGRWTACPVPISFYEDGDVADGQHRLWAIVESGKAQKFPVARGLSRGDGLNIDTGIGRGLLDAAKISGTDTGLSNELISVCRAIEDGTHANNVNTANRKSRSNSEKLALVDLHREAGNWVCTNGPRGKTIRSSIVLGAMGRAWYLESDKDRLRRFADVLGSGFQAGDEESAAIALRNYIQSKEALSSSALWRDTFLKVQNAISYFMRGKKLTVIKGVADESYPLRKVPHRRAKA